MKLTGVIVPHVTPLTSTEALDVAGLRRLIDFLLEAGVHGLFANGSMGGFAFLPDRVQFEAIEASLAHIAGRVPMVAGISDTSTSRVLERLRIVERMAPHAVVVMPPFYYLAQQNEIVHFFRTIADASSVPVLLYDNPRLAKNSLAPETIGLLARHPNIAGAKISAPDAQKWQEVLRQDLPRDRFTLICGAEPMMSLSLHRGFDGVTGGLHNLAPAAAVAMFDAARAGRWDDAEAHQRHLNRIQEIFAIDGGWRGAELTLATLGICDKVTAAPHDVALAPATRDAILSVIDRELAAAPIQRSDS